MLNQTRGLLAHNLEHADHWSCKLSKEIHEMHHEYVVDMEVQLVDRTLLQLFLKSQMVRYIYDSNCFSFRT